MSNIVTIESFLQRRNDKKKDEEVFPLNTLNISGSDFMIMSIQHQLNFMFHNAMAGFGQNIEEESPDFIRLIEIARSFFKDTFFTFENVFRVICRNIRYYENNENEAKQDRSVFITLCDPDALSEALITKILKPVLSMEIRLTDLSEPLNLDDNLSIDVIKFPEMLNLNSQVKSVVENILTISRNCGGNSFITSDGQLFVALPYSPVKQIIVMLELDSKFQYKSN